MLKLAAEHRKVSMNDIVQEALEEHLKAEASTSALCLRVPRQEKDPEGHAVRDARRLREMFQRKNKAWP